jgi:hypothetical protein
VNAKSVVLPLTKTLLPTSSSFVSTQHNLRIVIHVGLSLKALEGKEKGKREKNMGTKYVFTPEGTISGRVVSYQFYCRFTDPEKVMSTLETQRKLYSMITDSNFNFL